MRDVIYRSTNSDDFEYKVDEEEESEYVGLFMAGFPPFSPNLKDMDELGKTFDVYMHCENSQLHGNVATDKDLAPLVIQVVEHVTDTSPSVIVAVSRSARVLLKALERVVAKSSVVDIKTIVFVAPEWITPDSCLVLLQYVATKLPNTEFYIHYGDGDPNSSCVTDAVQGKDFEWEQNVNFIQYSFKPDKHEDKPMGHGDIQKTFCRRVEQEKMNGFGGQTSTHEQIKGSYWVGKGAVKSPTRVVNIQNVVRTDDKDEEDENTDGDEDGKRQVGKKRKRSKLGDDVDEEDENTDVDEEDENTDVDEEEENTDVDEEEENTDGGEDGKPRSQRGRVRQKIEKIEKKKKLGGSWFWTTLGLTP